jgi:Flp pilus assembly protein TadG
MAGGRKQTRGSALVELALVFVLFAVLFMGIMDCSQFLFHQQLLVEKVRAAARWGALHDPSDITAIRNMVLYSQAATPTDGRRPSFSLTSSMVEVSSPDIDTDNYRLTVRLSGYSYEVISPYLARRYNGPPIVVSVPLGLYR